MNISDTALMQVIANQLSVDQGNIANLQTQIASGKQLNKPSDNPSAVTQVLSLSSQASQLASWQDNAETAKAWLGTANSTATSVLDAMQTAHTLLLEASNQAAQNSTTYQAIGSQLQGIVSQLQFLANTQYGGRAIFAGTSASQAAYDSSGNYLGNTDVPTVVIGPGPGVGQTTGLSIPGPSVFGTGASNVFSVLTTISNDLLTGTPTSTQISTAINSLEANISTADRASATLGNASQEVVSVSSSLASQLSNVQTNQSGLEDINIATATTQLNTEMTNYQAALWAASRAIPETLAKFLGG